ncbi:GAF domain-containing sensor histidine kinase [Paenibacillus beijingensis]|uniref:GAF domain-containing sensor histidine kinase n=1 Tax=Paenibacillus beijingensis TaxID=1126833 RepID=UPI0006962C2E|nr:histidine kinase [Paenibacillus beijingensis]
MQAGNVSSLMFSQSTSRYNEDMDKMRGYRLLVGLFFAVTAALYANCIPGYYDRLLSQCISNGCGLSVPALTLDSGLSANATALLLIAIDCAFTAVFYATGAILLWKSSREPMGLTAALAMVAFGTSFPSLVIVGSDSASFAHFWFLGVSATGWISISLFCLLFPNGSFVPAWSRYAMGLIAVVDLANLFYDGNIWKELKLPVYLQFAWYLSTTMLLIFAQSYRFRRMSSPEQRQQTKWVVYGVAVSFVGFALISVLFDPRFFNGKATNFIYLNAALHLCLLAIPVTLTLAVLRQRLWDINPLVNRTVLYGALTVCVVLLYTLVVFYLGSLFATWSHFIVSLIATGIVAAVFAPIKEWLQRQVNRMLKGRHDDPYAVLLELGRQLMKPIAPDAMLTAIARQVRDALRLPYAGIAIGIEGQETMIAEAGERRDGLESRAFPIIYNGKTLGTLYAACRSAGETFSAEDSIFLEVMLRHAGPLVNNADMLQSMRRLAEDVQESREKLVLAREEERRRIRNNLHDDLAPRLAALALNAATARKYVEKDPAEAVAMLDDLRQVIRTTVEDIRLLVNDLRPPALDQLGLVGAIRTRMDEMAKPTRLISSEDGGKPLRFELEFPPMLPALRAGVEVAAYRIVTESMVNVVKHAEATVCKVRLSITDADRLFIEVVDDGIGTAKSQTGFTLSGGIGLLSMRERAAEIGGECGIERPAAGGTRIWAVLPL